MRLSRNSILLGALTLLVVGPACAHTEGVWATFPGAGFYPPVPDPLEGVGGLVVVATPAPGDPALDRQRSDELLARWAARLCALLEGTGRRCSVVAPGQAPEGVSAEGWLELAVTVSQRFEQTAPAGTHAECERFEQQPVWVDGQLQGLRPGACLELGEERDVPAHLVEGREGRAVLRLVVGGKQLREQLLRCSPLLPGADRDFPEELPAALVSGILAERRQDPAEYFLVDERQPQLAAGVAAFSRGDLEAAALRFREASASTTTELAAAARANLGQLRCFRGEGEAAVADLSVALDGLGCGGTGAPPDGSACERLRVLRFSGCRARIFATDARAP